MSPPPLPSTTRYLNERYLWRLVSFQCGDYFADFCQHVAETNDWDLDTYYALVAVVELSESGNAARKAACTFLGAAPVWGTSPWGGVYAPLENDEPAWYTTPNGETSATKPGEDPPSCRARARDRAREEEQG